MFGLGFTRAYFDDLLLVSRDSVEFPFIILKEVFTRLASVGLNFNATKSHFCCDELEYLGYLISRKGVRPMMNYYRDM
jgi:hypothetical protein